MRNLIGPGTTLRQLVRIRPLAVTFLESHGMRFWSQLDRSVAHFCEANRVDAEKLLDQAAAVEIPSRFSDWDSLPLCHLLDFLTQQHRDFIQNDMNDIRYHLDLLSIPLSGEGFGFPAAQREFERLCTDILTHIEEEEGFLFPKILRYEACIKDRSVQPELHQGSINVFLALKNYRADRNFCSSLRSIRERLLSPSISRASASANEEACRLLLQFEERIAEHMDTESNILFPQATDRERSLYNLMIQG